MENNSIPCDWEAPCVIQMIKTDLESKNIENFGIMEATKDSNKHRITIAGKIKNKMLNVQVYLEERRIIFIYGKYQPQKIEKVVEFKANQLVKATKCYENLVMELLKA